MPRDEVLVADILRYARQAERAAAGLTAADLEANPDRQSMVLWPLIVLGEAAAHVSDAFRQAHPGIPWRRMVGLRNVLIHDYSGVDMAAVAEVVENHLPDLIQRLELLGLSEDTLRAMSAGAFYQRSLEAISPDRRQSGSVPM